MSDLVTRLRQSLIANAYDEGVWQLVEEAADRIEALENWAQLHRGDTLSLNNEVKQCWLEIDELSRRGLQPTDDKINEAFKRATDC